MFRKDILTTARYFIAIFFLLVIVLTGCSRSSPTPVPTPRPISSPIIMPTTPPPTPPPPTDTPKPPDVTLTLNPDETTVKSGQKIAFVVETKDRDVQFAWSAVEGTLSAYEGSAIIYTAPDSASVDIVTLEASNDGGTTVEHISFQIVAHPTKTPTSTPGDTPTPSPTLVIPDAIITASIRLRSGPGTMYDSIGVLNPSQVLTVTGRSDSETSWLQVNTDQEQAGWVANRQDLLILNLSPEQIPVVSPPPTPTPPPPAFTGKVCQIKSGQDTNTIFVRQAEFDRLGLPLGTRVAVTIRETGKIVYILLGLDSGLRSCVVRLPKLFRETLGVANDTDIDLEIRPVRSFDVVPSPPSVDEFKGKICQIRSGHDANTVYLRRLEYNAFGVPAGTAVNVTVLGTGQTVENVTLGLDSGLATCVVRLPKSLREALGVEGDTDLELDERPIRQFRVRLP